MTADSASLHTPSLYTLSRFRPAEAHRPHRLITVRPDSSDRPTLAHHRVQVPARSLVVATPNPRRDRSILDAFARTGMDVMATRSLAEAVRQVYASHPDVLLLDQRVGDIDTDVIHSLRVASNAIIMVRVPAGEVAQLVAALDAGADDAVFSTASDLEIVARVQGMLRRMTSIGVEAPRPIDVTRPAITGDLLIDLDNLDIRKSGRRVRLRPTEMRLLRALVSRMGQVVTHRELLRQVWGSEYVDDTYFLRIYIGYLRAKLEDDPARPRYFINQHGIGYMLDRLPPVMTVHEAAG